MFFLGFRIYFSCQKINRTLGSFQKKIYLSGCVANMYLKRGMNVILSTTAKIPPEVALATDQYLGIMLSQIDCNVGQSMDAMARKANVVMIQSTPHWNP
jgi:hypothetical protein